MTYRSLSHRLVFLCSSPKYNNGQKHLSERLKRIPSEKKIDHYTEEIKWKPRRKLSSEKNKVKYEDNDDKRNTVDSERTCTTIFGYIIEQNLVGQK